MATRDKDPSLTRRQSENLRAKIAMGASQIVQRLQSHVAGDAKMTATQVAAAKILLERCVPSMQAIDQTTRDERPTLSPAQLDELLAGQLTRLARETPDSLRAALADADRPPLRVVGTPVDEL